MFDYEFLLTGSVSWVYGTLLLSLLVQPASAEITKPFGEWICNYCAMGRKKSFCHFCFCPQSPQLGLAVANNMVWTLYCTVD